MNNIFLDKAYKLLPELKKDTVYPLKETEPERDRPLRFDEFLLDFGTHVVGYFTIKVRTDPVPDSPLKIKLFFAEMPLEMEGGQYTGGLSSSWIQEEIITVDNPLEPIRLPRRYAFRYVKVAFTANTAYQVYYDSSFAEAVSAVSMDDAAPLPPDTDYFLKKIDEVSLRTLKNCMQTVFEDGPKRDRRLWLGDLYLQAKANYVSFKDYDLVRRCLYLFAGLPHPDGTLSSAVFFEPMLKNQAWIIHDYALFFGGTLADYYDETKDIDTVNELWPIAFRQAEIVSQSRGEDGLVPVCMYFIDWCVPLDKTVAAQATAIAMLKKHLYLANIVGDSENAAKLTKWIEEFTAAALKLYNPARCLFQSKQEASDGVFSVISQSWAIISGIVSKDEGRRILTRLDESCGKIETVTPYARHYYVEALIKCGMMDKAKSVITEYWGEMVRKGADCFWEVYVPWDEFASPYGDRRINSYCHAWSCTATYFIRKYFTGKKS